MGVPFHEFVAFHDTRLLAGETFFDMNPFQMIFCGCRASYVLERGKIKQPGG